MQVQIEHYFKKLKEGKFDLWAGSLLLLYFIYKLHASILARFNFAVTDMDQVLMWYGVQEMRNGEFHMPRYFGQNYGSMLEAWISIPFTWVDYNVLLPLVAYFLLIVPYACLLFTSALSKPHNLLKAAVVLCFLGAMPAEYIMMGSMPRDLVTGIAVTALAILFVQGNRPYHLILIGFFSLLGWSFNANAALLGATLTIYALVKNDSGLSIGRRVVWLGTGYLLAGLIHLCVEWYMVTHPYLIIHNQWPIRFELAAFLTALTNIDMHWSHIAVLFHNKGWIYIVILLSLAYVAKKRKQNHVLYATICLAAITLLSLGITKTHDGTESVFMSYGRMYLALPVASLFLLSRIEFKAHYVKLLIPAIVVMLYYEREALPDTIGQQMDGKLNSAITISYVEHLKRDCAEIETLWKKYGAQAIIFGPGNLHQAWSFSRGCPCLTEIDLMVRPEYERKTWDMERLNKDDFTQFLWFSSADMDSIIMGIGTAQITRLDSIMWFPNIYLIQGEDINPLKMYRNAGFEEPNDSD